MKKKAKKIDLFAENCETLKSGNTNERCDAANTFGLAGIEAIPILFEVLKENPEITVKSSIVLSVGYIISDYMFREEYNKQIKSIKDDLSTELKKDPGLSISLAQTVLYDWDYDKKEAAAHALKLMGDKILLPALNKISVALHKEDKYYVCEHLINVLKNSGNNSPVDGLISLLYRCHDRLDKNLLSPAVDALTVCRPHWDYSNIHNAAYHSDETVRFKYIVDLFSKENQESRQKIEADRQIIGEVHDIVASHFENPDQALNLSRIKAITSPDYVPESVYINGREPAIGTEDIDELDSPGANF